MHYILVIGGLEWCHSHLKACQFQSAIFLTDYQSALPSSPRPQRFSNKSSGIFGSFLTDSLSSRVALSFQWVPGHAGLLGNKLADLLAKTG